MAELTEFEDDPQAEVAAMQAIATALGPLSRPGKVRVLRWAGDLFGAGISAVMPRVSGSTGKISGSLNQQLDAVTTVARSAAEFSDLAEFFSAANPDTEAKKALVVAYWRQFREGEADVDTQTINTALKHLGFGIGNITRAFEVLKDSRPQLVVQLRKDGTSRQARKRLKVTTEGQREVERMIALQSQT